MNSILISENDFGYLKLADMNLRSSSPVQRNFPLAFKLSSVLFFFNTPNSLDVVIKRRNTVHDFMSAQA